jgi:hypothetical protein
MDWNRIEGNCDESDQRLAPANRNRNQKDDRDRRQT